MRLRVFHLLVVLSVGLASFRVEAQVQSFPVVNVEVFVERERKMPSDRLFINQRQCQGIDESGAGSAEIRVQITNLREIAPLANVLEFWLGPEGADCYEAEGRTRGASGRSPCVMVAPPLESISNKRQNLYFVAHDLFASPESPGGVCDRLHVQTLYVVPLVNPTSTQVSEITAESAVGGAAFVRFEVEVEPPAQVSGFTGGTGELTTEVTWQDALPDAEHEFEIYFDTTAIQLANPGSCASELLREGEALPLDLTQLGVRTTQESRLLLDLAELGLLPGEKMPATVVVRDKAGNRSVAAEVVCVERTFAEAQATARGPRDDSCLTSCAVGPRGARTRAHWASWGAALVVGFQVRLWRRRRRLPRKSS